MPERPFSQRQYDSAGLKLRLPLQGPAYKFTILLPELDNNGDQIFESLERDDLRTLFSDDFGGYTCTNNVVQPHAVGRYVNELRRHVIDRHTVFEVYTKQTDEVLAYFRELARRLTLYSRDAISRRVPGYTGEDQIFIEMLPVMILDTWLDRGS